MPSDLVSFTAIIPSLPVNNYITYTRKKNEFTTPPCGLPVNNLDSFVLTLFHRGNAATHTKAYYIFLDLFSVQLIFKLLYPGSLHGIYGATVTVTVIAGYVRGVLM